MRSNYAQGSYSEQYDDNCICGFLHLVVMLASKLLVSPSPSVCLPFSSLSLSPLSLSPFLSFYSQQCEVNYLTYPLWSAT